MNPETPSQSNDTSHQHNVYAHLHLDEVIEMVTQVSIVYTSLEYIIMKEGMKLSDSSRINMRRAQADIQKLRLKLLDALDTKEVIKLNK